ncbi:hypothetical protein [Pseudonocardia sp. T1-2H]|uniref:hypothetical protein n=1 Tax=Pseudonocardia sp. T1-2H TaxID=3128899 RepID=UPI0031010F4F
MITVRLVVRRVRPTPGSQLALFTDWDYHAMVTTGMVTLCKSSRSTAVTPWSSSRSPS